MRTIWLSPDDDRVVLVLDQRQLPHRVVIEALRTADDAARAIRDMHVRGAGVIGAAAGYGMYLSALRAPTDSEEAFLDALRADGAMLEATRPTAANLAWAVRRVLRAAEAADGIAAKQSAVRREADAITEEDVDFCRRIGGHGVALIEEIHRRKNGGTVNILTHCNAGALACVEYGTATAPIYEAVNRSIPVHVYVDETRPRNQGAQLTAYELGQNGVSHAIIADNTGGHLMQHGLVDMVIVGCDRATSAGDVANKIGTYLKALAARDNKVSFYVALTSSAIDWTLGDGVREIPIETRDPNELKYITGLAGNGRLETVLITPADSPAVNYGFDVTPARLITALITENGICPASREGLRELYPTRGNV